MISLYIIVPAYNEEENIYGFVESWYPVIEKIGGESKLVVIDDGSKDKTYEVLCALSKDRPYLCPLTKSNSGHGPTLLYGYKYAIENHADYIFQTDSDGQTDGSEFQDFWNMINEYDAIIGNRLNRGDGKLRKYIENMVCFLLKIIFGVSVKDANAPFRLMKTELINKYIDRLPKDFNLPNIMFTTYFVYYNENITFRPITFKARQGGLNSMNIRKIAKIGIKAIGDFRKLKKQMRK
ncbi:MAG: glycosyltransferase family 2 protein [Abditibacteriota bacterium]|nr:glycosyltransferase family 2 protein [Abditibacteriota bacterium]